MSDLAQVIKQMALDASDAENPDKVVFGVVTMCSQNEIVSFNPWVTEFVIHPLEVQLTDKKITLSKANSFLIVPKDFQQQMDTAQEPQYVNIGDKIALLRIEKGSKYLVLDVV